MKNLARLLLAALLLSFLTSSAAFAQPLSGAYTINSGAATGGTNFQTFQDAVRRLRTGPGVAGPVTFTVTAGTYTDSTLYFDSLSCIGASTTNKITFISANNQATINFNGDGSNNFGITGRGSGLLFDRRTHDITWDGINIVNNGTGETSGIRNTVYYASTGNIDVDSMTYNLTFRNCTMDGGATAATQNSNSRHFRYVNGSHHDHVHENLTLVGVRNRAASLFAGNIPGVKGTDYVFRNVKFGTAARPLRIEGAGTGVLFSEHARLLIEGCEFNFANPSATPITGSFFPVHLQGTPAGVTVRNCVINTNVTVTGTNQVSGIMTNFTGGASDVLIEGNSISVTGSQANTFAINCGSARRLKIVNNTYTAVVGATTSGTGTIALNASAFDTVTVVGNTINGVTGAITTGIQVSGDSTNVGAYIANNVVKGVATLDTVTGNSIAIGLDIINVRGTVIGNKIDNISSANEASSSGVVVGINISVDSTRTLTVSNNFVSNVYSSSLASPIATNRVSGISTYKAAGGGGTIQLYHNSVYVNSGIGLTSVGAAGIEFGGEGNTNVLRNNLVINALDGDATAKPVGFLHYDASAFTSNNNSVAATGTGGTFGVNGTTTLATLATWRTNTSQDANSFSDNALKDAFVDAGTGDLHLLSSFSGNASLVGSVPPLVPTDIDGDSRTISASNPSVEIGADEISTSSVTPIAGVPAKDFRLEQNYPNPFNPSTTIRFALPAAANATLKVYDMLGREVAALLNNERLASGTYNIKFDAARLSTGTYFYRLTSGSFTETRKMLLVK